ncbi:MAG TPA: amidohydrolase family protein [Gemmatimonadaceae bacterium]|nr:amidohydrolase family protein [Gemmatimonadaceae bacterium]
MRRRRLVTFVLLAGTAGCAQLQTSTAPRTAAADTSARGASGGLSLPRADAFPSTYAPHPSRPTVIRNVTLLTAAGPAIPNGAILLRDGRIAAVGPNVEAPADAVIIDGTGKYVTPGLIDTHSHIGAGAAPGGGTALSDVNEATNPVTGHVWIEHSVWPQDPQFPRTLAGGVTSIQILPGSANLIGGRGVVLKIVPARTVQAMKFPGAPYGLKMACGENPKRVYASRSGGPSTRMANIAGYRAAWIGAEKYRREWDAWLASRSGTQPTRDLGNETMAEVLRGNILVHNHCYRADEMAHMIDIAREFGYRIRSFHHGVEAYKIADVLAREEISGSLWADWGSFKVEALDAIKANIALVDRAGARAIVHSDDASGSQRLNQEAAKAMYAGIEAGIPITEERAVRWLTINPAWALGIDDRVGSLEVGKQADVVLWSASPFSVYSRAEKVWVDGALLFDRLDPAQQWRTDFELGYVPRRGM